MLRSIDSSLERPDPKEEELPLKMPALRVSLWLLASLISLFVVLPPLYLFFWALTGSEVVGVLDDHASTRRFEHILASPEWQASIIYSVILAGLVSIVSCILLLWHFYYMRYVSPLLDRLAYISVLVVILIPAVVYALALRIIGGSLHISEISLLFIGHTIFVIPVQYFVFESKQESISSELLHAGSTLGASHLKNIAFVYLPLMTRALWLAFLVGFFFSFDELVVSTFVIDSTLVTVPRRLWDQVPRSMDPSPAVISCLLAMAFTLTLAATTSLRYVLLKLRRSRR